MRTFPLTWQHKSPRTDQAFSGNWPGPLFSLSPSITRGEGFSLTTRLPVRIPQHGVFPSRQEAKNTAQRVFNRFAASITPTTSPTAPAATLVGVLKALAPPLTGDRPTDATHHRLITELSSNGTPHRETGDSAGQYVVVDLLDAHVMHFHNPLGPDYGYDWDITDATAQQILTGTLRLGAADTAHRIHSLLSILD
ncbi:hypothetical protein [Streptomyces parvus]|uniref:hypothetical protein n=1 Tax=Streptomyces parvus TaxID=66428 RepID=UPI0021007BD8|nr:hypothetical protein [Streptomyces parvus]MCQ1577229.1 hypothetical protein [Streptomyces parvus]